MAQLRVLLGFTNAPDHSLEETAGAVIAGMTGNAAYPSPPVTIDTLKGALADFTAAIAAQAQGGTQATADKNNKRDVLVGLLRQLAGYVQQNCKNDLATLLSSGFEAVSTSRTQSPLDNPAIVSIDNGNTGQLLVKVTPIANAKCYEVRYCIAGAQPPQWQSGGLFTNSRSMPVNGLTPGTTYTFRVRAISTGFSDWSDPVSHMPIRGCGGGRSAASRTSACRSATSARGKTQFENHARISNCHHPQSARKSSA
jgi:fibronectin type III domain protein